MSNTNSSTAPLKTEAKALRKYLAEQGVELGHSKCLEAVAQMHGFKNWDAATATLEESQPPLFTVSNHHFACSGTPPSLDGDQPGYFSYFENSEGEQAILHWDRKAKSGTLYMGDCEWDQPIKVDGRGRTMPGTVLGPDERTWLRGCLSALRLLPSRGRPHSVDEVKEEIGNFMQVYGRLPRTHDLPEIDQFLRRNGTSLLEVVGKTVKRVDDGDSEKPESDGYN